MNDEYARSLERSAANGDVGAQDRLNHIRVKQMNGPFSHFMGEFVIFVDDYSHYRGKVIREFPLSGGSLFHVEPCYQISKFKTQGPENSTRVDNGGPVVIDSRRFKIITIQPDEWPMD